MVMPISNDQTISNGGMVNDAYSIAYWFTQAVYFGGALMKFTGAVETDGIPKVGLCDRATRPIGYSLKSTLDPVVPYNYIVDAHYATPVIQERPLSVSRLRDGDVISMPVCGGNAVIAVGDKVGVQISGEIDNATAISGGYWILGIALDAAAADVADIGSVAAAGSAATCIRVRIQGELVVT
jgi:hypothetical protein